MKNTEKLANSTIEKIKSEFNSLENEKNQCLSIFRETANDLQKINEELNITIVVVTHQMEVVKQICNKMVFLKHGKIVASGKPEELFVSSNEDILDFTGNDVDILPETGINIKLFFLNSNSKSHTITSLARDLNLDFDICQGRLENFRGKTMGSLIINIEDDKVDQVLEYLKKNQVEWEVIEHV